MVRIARLRPIFIVVACWLAMAAPRSGLAWEAPVEGGPGGGPFRVQCNSGSFMVGFEGRTGAFIDHLRILCGVWDAASRQVRPVGANQVILGTSQGGGPARQMCLNGWAIRRIDFENTWTGGGTDRPRQNGFVHHITFSCAWAGSAEEMRRTYGPTTPPVRPTFMLLHTERYIGTSYTQECPSGQWATGLQGRSGLYLDALGLICAPIPAAVISPTLPNQTGIKPMTPGAPNNRSGLFGSSQGTPPPGTAQPPAAPPPPLPGMQGQQPVDDQGRMAMRQTGFTGNWHTFTDKNWTYQMSLRQDGTRVNGTYVAQNGANGRITGRVRGDVLEFTWTQDGGFKGTGQFSLSPNGNSFSGVYRSEPHPSIKDPRYLQGTWNGTRR